LAVLTIKGAAEVKNVSGTPYTSGGSMADGTYYYRVSVLTEKGESPAGPESQGITISEGNGNGRIELTWDAVAGATSYKIYRTTISGSYEDTCYIANPTTNSYVDTAASPSQGEPVSFSSDTIQAAPVEETSLLVSMGIPGREGGALQHLGSPPAKLTIRGIFQGVSSKTDLEKLRVFRYNGIPIELSIVAHGETWVEGTYLIERLLWELEAGSPQESGGEKVSWTLNLIRSGD